MASRDAGRILYRKPLGEVLHDENASALHKYQNFFVGSQSIWKLLHYEVAMLLASPLPGAMGFFLRQRLLPGLFRKMGKDVMLGRNLSLRYPGAISIGDRTAIDENCLLDAKGCREDGIEIGQDVLIARDTLIQAKNSAIVIGDHSVIGSQTRLSSAGGLFIGKYVNIGSQCHIGGGRYRTNNIDTPIITQPLYTNGPVVIEDDVWIGAGVTIQDSVHIGRGSVISPGVTIYHDVPANTILMPHQRLTMIPRV